MRRTAVFTALLVPALALAANKAPVPAPAKAPPVPLLWKVSDANNSVYLLGSFHMLREDDYPLSKDVDNALADSESVLFELPPEEMGSAELGMKMAMAAIRTDGTTLDSDLSPELSAKLAAWANKNEAGLRRINMTPEMLQAFEPWYVSLLVTILDAGTRGFESKLGLDNHIAASAKAANKTAGGLETGMQQLDMLDGMDKAQQLQMLDESLSDSGNEHELDLLHREWRAGDVDALAAHMVNEVRTKYPSMYERINTQRNDTWVPKLEARLAASGTDDTLVVVGAMHLLGNDGVVEKLRKKGYKVERVCSACAVK
ncbi:TraB/GumN family protein [Lysobacter sp. KIS68-7]|uniref:TraB/GumN family protein n=1 Tax=Lysobacter sp. KIS68-7 TaxID=2904252 RepID=UPI001E335FFA|nr:TraB/GumN family protein [Lysobacter sp. KIS68-7]UHQ18639.1 TraB/GumN family protein [Lysobacter sp. KIS68-7]